MRSCSAPGERPSNPGLQRAARRPVPLGALSVPFMFLRSVHLTSQIGGEREPPFSNTVLDLRFDVLVHAKEVLRVVLLLDRREPVVVGTVGSFDRVFSLLT
jgi:hypothetical protein